MGQIRFVPSFGKSQLHCEWGGVLSGGMGNGNGGKGLKCLVCQWFWEGRKRLGGCDERRGMGLCGNWRWMRVVLGGE